MSCESERAIHARLVLRMADRLGVDLDEAMMRAEIDEDTFQGAVDRCIGCTQPIRCRTLLDTVSSQFELPEFCRNGDLFESKSAP